MPLLAGNYMSFLSDYWVPSTATTTTASTTADADTDEPTLTLEQFNYFCRLAKKNKKLAAIGREVLDGIAVKLPF